MISKTYDAASDTTTLTFTVRHDAPLSFLTSINGWQPSGFPLYSDRSGNQSITLRAPAGAEIAFRYASSDGYCFDEADADRIEPNGLGETNSIVIA